MATTDTLQIVIKLKDLASRGLKRMGRSFATMRGGLRKLTGAFTGLKGAIAGAVATVGLGLLARSFVKAAATAENYRVRLNTLLGSQREGARAFEEMAKYAGTVSFQFEEVMGSATQLSGIMEGGVDEIKQWMPMIADLATVAGITIQEATGQVIRMYSAGAASADLFRERGVLAMLGFQAKTAYTAKETRKMLIASFEDPASKWAGVSIELAKTWNGLLSMMGDAWFQFRIKVMSGGPFEIMKEGVTELLAAIDKIKETGELDIWAYRMAVGVLSAFELMVQAASFFIKFLLHTRIAFNKIGIEWRAFNLKKVKGEFNELYEALDTNKLSPKLKAMWAIAGEDWQTPMRKRLVKLTAEMQELSLSGGDSAEALHDNIIMLEGFTSLIDKAIAKLEEAKKARGGAEEKFGKEVPRLKPPKTEDPKLTAARTVAELRKQLEDNKTVLAVLEDDWARHNVKLEGYFKDRLALLTEAYEAQRQILEQRLELEKDPAKQQKAKADIYALDQQNIRDIIALQMEVTEAVKGEVEARKQASDVIQGIENRLLSARAQTGGLAEIFKQEQEQLRQQQQSDFDALMELKAEGYDIEKEMADAKNKHILENEQLAANQRKQIWDTYVSSIQSTLGGMTKMFNDWYQAAGGQHKELFNLYKAAAMAETIISTYSSAQKAYESMAKVSPALAAAAAAVAIASGLARVALIAQQKMASGGEVGAFFNRPVHTGKVKGVSPHKKADNIMVHATAGEFMQPVDVVKYYSLRGMEAIRRKLIPRDVLEYYANGGARAAIRRAAGGMIPGVSPHKRSDNIRISATAGEFMQPVDAVNYYTRRGMEVVRQMLIPRELLLAFANANTIPRIPKDAAYAAGGAVAKPVGAGGDTNLSMGVTVNLPEHLDFIGRRLEAEIEPVVMRVLQEEIKY